MQSPLYQSAPLHYSAEDRLSDYHVTNRPRERAVAGKLSAQLPGPIFCPSPGLLSCMDGYTLTEIQLVQKGILIRIQKAKKNLTDVLILLYTTYMMLLVLCVSLLQRYISELTREIDSSSFT